MESVLDQFTCGQCQEKLDSLTAFLLHKVQHVDMGKPGACPLCGTAFSRQVSLREHLHRKHNIPELRSSFGKRGSNLRTELPGQGAGLKTPGAESKVTTISVSESSAPQNFISQETMHVVVDSIKESDLRQLNTSDLSNTVLSADCSVVYHPSSSATVLLETCGDNEFGHLMGQVNRVSPPHAFQPHSLQNHTDNLQNQSHPSPHQHAALKNSSQTLEKHLHLLQHDQNSLPTLPVQKDCADQGEVAVTASATGDHIVTSESQSSFHLQPPVPQTLSSTSESGSQEEPELDFLFVLLTNHVKRKSMSYSKQSFKCFHCQYRTFWRRSLVKHMKETHSDNLAIHQCIAVSNSEKMHGQQVMKMSDYLQVLTRQRKQVNGHRIRGVEKQDLPGYHPCSKCGKVCEESLGHCTQELSPDSSSFLILCKTTKTLGFCRNLGFDRNTSCRDV